MPRIPDEVEIEWDVEGRAELAPGIVARKYGGIIEVHGRDYLPAPTVIASEQVAIEEICRAWHDFDCEDGTACPNRLEHADPSNYDRVLPRLLSIANLASTFTGVRWIDLLPKVGGCVATTEILGREVECQRYGLHDPHEAEVDGHVLSWVDEPPVEPEPEVQLDDEPRPSPADEPGSLDPNL